MARRKMNLLSRFARLALTLALVLHCSSSNAMLPGMIPIAITKSPAQLSFIAATVDAADLTTYTFSGQSFGAAAADRYIIVGYTASFSSGGPFSVSSATIGGVSAAVYSEVQNAAVVVGFLIAAVPTGTSGTIAITFSSGMLRSGIGVWRVTSFVSAVPTATASDIVASANALDASLTIPTDGFGLGVVYTGLGTAGTYTWTNLTEQYDQSIESTRQQSGAHSTTAGTSTRTATFSQTMTTPALSLAAWR